MKTLDKYLVREFLQSVFAALVVLLMVMVGAAFTYVLKDIATGRLPPGLIFAQLGLVMIGWMPLILPLALMLGLLLAMSRLYRDAEMPVLASVGVGPRRLLGPLLTVVAPMVAVIALCSLWLAPWSDRYSRAMVKEANRNMLIAGGLMFDSVHPNAAGQARIAEAVRARAVARVRGCVEALGWRVRGVVPSPIEGGDGNIEFLLGAVKDTA